ncbi:MAG: enamine deaminase RidA [Planctomycetaceae bacterium]|nr:enamine deaminase RidA [Planctomycetaceae bacterium]
MNQPKRDTEASRRSFVNAALVGAAGGLLLPESATSGAESSGEEFQKRSLSPAGAPAADSGYSPAIVSAGNRMLFISGQGPEDLTADMETQVRQTFDRIGLLLKEAGAGFEHVVILRSYWVHLLRDLPIYRKVRKDYLVKPYPASTAVGTPELAIPGLELEIEAVAVLP